MMKIDFDHWRGAEIANSTSDALDEMRALQLVAMLKPEFTKDGNMYCFTYPSMQGLPNDCVQGFGSTAIEAAHDFNNNFYNRKA